MEDLLEKLTDAATYCFKSDGTKPGVLVSKIKDEVYYASVVRYPKDNLGEKQVEVSARGFSVKSALEELAVKFLSSLKDKQSPIDKLSQKVKEFTKND